MKTAFILFFILMFLSTYAKAQQTFNSVKVKELQLPSEDVSTVLFLDGDKKVRSSNTSYAELENLSGVTSPIQTQLNAKSSDLSAHESDTSTHGVSGAIVGTTEAQALTNKAIESPSRLDPKKDVKATLTSYAATAQNGEMVFATDTKEFFVVKDGALSVVGGGGLSPWETAKSYAINDIIHESGRIYKALTAHTSGTFATDLAAAKWVLISDELNSKSLYGTVSAIKEIQSPNNQLTTTATSKALLETGNKNILVNPSFEHSTFSTGWTNSVGTFTEETAIEIDGLKAAKLVLSAQTMSLTQSSTLYASQFADGVQGLAMVRVKSDVALKVCAIQAGVVSTSLCVDVPAHNKWGLYKVPFILGATSNGISIASSGNVTGTVYVDEGFLGAVDLSATQSFDTTCDTIACETNLASYVDASGNHNSENKDFISSVSVASTSTFTVNFNASVFISPPSCVITTADGSGATTNGSVVTILSSTTTSLIYRTNRHDATAVAYPVFIHCDRTATDYTAAINAQKAFQKSKVSSYSSGTLNNLDRISEIIFTSSATAPSGFISALNSSIGQAGSGANFTGDIYRALYDILWAQAGTVITAGHVYRISSAKGASASADWAANKTITIDYQTSGAFVRAKAAARGAGVYEASDNLSHQHGMPLGPNAANGFYGLNTTYNQTYTSMNLNPGSGFSGGTEAKPNAVSLHAYIRFSGDTQFLVGQFNGLESCTDSYECTDTLSFSVSNTGVVSNENLDTVSGNCTVSDTSLFTCTYRSGLQGNSVNLSGPLNCAVSIDDANSTDSSMAKLINTSSSTQLVFRTGYGSTPPLITKFAYATKIICQKQGADYIGKTAKAVASDQNLRTPTITNAVLHSCAFTNNATTIAIDSNYSTLCNAWIQSVSRTTTGTAAIVVKTGAFSSLPICTGATPAANFGRFVEILPNSVTSITAEVNAGNDSLVDKAFQIICHGIAP